MTRAHNGFLITFEGGDGGGKTTQIARLKDRLVEAGKDVTVVREPGGTMISEKIREIVLDTKNTQIDYTTEALLFQAARAQIYSEIVLPALEAGRTVLMDRSRDSSVIYNGIVRGLGAELIERLNDISTKETYPDLTLLLDVEPKTGLQRVQEVGQPDRFEAEGVSLQERVREAYKQLVSADASGRWRTVDANQSLEEVEAEIWRLVSSALSL